MCWISLVAGQSVDKAELAKKQAEVRRILNDEQATIDPVFDQYFKDYFLPQFVAAAPRPDDLPKLRRELRNFTRAAKNVAATTALNKMVYDKLSAIVTKSEGIKPDSPYAGAIKYNALLAMGEMTDIDGGKQKPSASAFQFLLRLLKANAAKDYMKAAALIGMERNAAAKSIPAASVPDLTKVLLDLVNQKDPPPGRDAAAHQYLRRSAAQVLAVMGSPGPDNSVAKAFAMLAAEQKLRPTFRCEMVQFIGQLKYPKTPESGAELQRLATCMARQTTGICKQELDGARTAGRQPSRQLLVYALARAYDGLVALQPAVAGTATQKYIGNITGKLRPMITEVEGKESIDELTSSELEGKLRDIETLLDPDKPLGAPDKSPQTATTQ